MVCILVFDTRLEGSIPSTPAIYRLRSTDRTERYERSNRGSIPLGGTKYCPSSVTVAHRSPKPLAGVRLPGGMPTQLIVERQ